MDERRKPPRMRRRRLAPLAGGREGMSPRTSGGEGVWTRLRDGKRDQRTAWTAVEGHRCGRVTRRAECGLPPQMRLLNGRDDLCPVQIAAGVYCCRGTTGRGSGGPPLRGQPRVYIAADERRGPLV